MEHAPQIENGYTRIANELFDALISAKLTSRQVNVVLAVIRKTYGYNKKSDDIGLSQLSDMTGIAKAHLSVTVRELETMRIVLREKGTYGHSLGINKHYRDWILPEKGEKTASRVTESVTPATETVTVTESVTGGYQISNQRVTETVTPPVTETVTTKDNLSKDNQKTKPKDKLALDARFEKFYAAYPNKKSRVTAEKAFAKLNPDEQLLETMLVALERAMKSGGWDDAKRIPFPATWLNQRRWEDEVQCEYSDTERAVIQAFNDVLGEQLGKIEISIFDAGRASAIRAFLGFSEKENFWGKFFSWVLERTSLPPKVGFDYLISREGFTKVKGGQHTKMEAA